MSTAAIIAALAVFAFLLERGLHRRTLPVSVLLVATGFLGSELITALGGDLGLRWHSFHALILHLLVPVLVFESAYKLPLGRLLPNLGLILVLAIPGTLIAALLTGLGLYYGIAVPGGFPLVSALLFGVIASATDPVAVINLFERLGVPPRLTTLIEGESLLNDAVAIVAFGVLVSLAVAPSEPGLLAVGGQFLWSVAGGLLVGLTFGALAWQLDRLALDSVHHSLVAIAAGVVSLWAAEQLLQASGIVAVLTSAIMIGERHRCHHPEHRQTAQTAELLAWLANAMVFLLMGMTITPGMFTSHWLAMLIAIAAATAARAVNSHLLLPLACGLRLGAPLPPAWRGLIFWGGLRGAVSLALVLAIPTEVTGWYTIQSAVYGVVLFTLLVQATTAEPLVRRLLATPTDRRRDAR